MQPKRTRRVYSAEFKAEVLAECEQPGVSVSAISLARGLNVNLVRKWLVGRGLKRTGLEAPRVVAAKTASAAHLRTDPAPTLQFVPVELTTSPTPSLSNNVDIAETDIRIELQRGNSKLSVQWPSSQASACAAWLLELATGALK